MHTVSTVHLHLVLVILPHYAKLYDALRDGGDLQRGFVFGVLLEKGRVFKCRGEFCWGKPSAEGLLSYLIVGAYLCTPARILALREDLTWLVWLCGIVRVSDLLEGRETLDECIRNGGKNSGLGVMR